MTQLINCSIYRGYTHLSMPSAAVALWFWSRLECKVSKFLLTALPNTLRYVSIRGHMIVVCSHVIVCLIVHDDIFSILIGGFVPVISSCWLQVVTGKRGCWSLLGSWSSEAWLLEEGWLQTALLSVEKYSNITQNIMLVIHYSAYQILYFQAQKCEFKKKKKFSTITNFIRIGLEYKDYI